jgi:hypothetical protein
MPVKRLSRFRLVGWCGRAGRHGGRDAYSDQVEERHDAVPSGFNPEEIHAT